MSDKTIAKSLIQDGELYYTQKLNRRLTIMLVVFATFIIVSLTGNIFLYDKYTEYQTVLKIGEIDVKPFQLVAQQKQIEYLEKVIKLQKKQIGHYENIQGAIDSAFGQIEDGLKNINIKKK